MGALVGTSATAPDRETGEVGEAGTSSDVGDVDDAVEVDVLDENAEVGGATAKDGSSVMGTWSSTSIESLRLSDHMYIPK